MAEHARLVLGLASSHDASACVFRDGRLAAALAEERLSRIKCDGGRLPARAIDRALEIAGAVRGDVDVVASIYGHFPEAYFRRETLAKELERRLSRALKRLAGRPSTTQFSSSNLLKHLARTGEPFDAYFRRRAFLAGEGFRPDARVCFYDHHLTHAAAAAYYCGAARAAVVTLDGEGDLGIFFTASRWANGRLERDRACAVPGASPGFFYEEITRLLGFRPLRHEGKVLGLAAHGDPALLGGAFRKALRADGPRTGFASDFADAPRPGEERSAYLARAIAGHRREDVAAAAQAVLEESALEVIRGYLRQTGERTLALNGGVFANVKLNQRLAALAEVDSVFVFPGMSDTGNSVGAALLALEEREPGYLGRNERLADVYWGPEYGTAEIERELERSRLRFERLAPEALVERAAQAVHAGRVVGWFQGRMEFGPRALGNRSIVAAPVDGTINRTLNERLERTEFMPFAPSVLAERAAEVFENIPKCGHTAEFMTITCDVRPGWRERIPAVVHVDGTARPQLVRREVNPRYHRLIARYAELSGIPVVLNTSFNVHEEPIVCGPAEAARALAENRIDALAIGEFWVRGAA
jgi:carbamoyltransferase